MAATWNFFKCRMLTGGSPPLLAPSSNDIPNATFRAKTQGNIMVVFMVMATAVVLLEGYGCITDAKPSSSNVTLVSLVETTGGSDVVEDILNPDKMFIDFGFVSAPVVGVTMKALFNFFAQLAFLIGTTILAGKMSIRDRLSQEPDFGKWSVAFQIVGQLSALFAYTSLALSTQCWEKFANWQKFSFGVSQHSSTNTLIVGFANNVIMSFIASTPGQRKAGKTLVITGLIVGVPIWSTTASALVSWGGVVPGFFIVAELFVFCFMDMKTFGEYTISVSFSWTFVSGVVMMWFVLGVWRHPFYASMLLGATLIELILPALFLWLFFGLVVSKDEMDINEIPSTVAALFWSFVLALLHTYMVTMAVPTCILTQRDPGYFFTGAVLTFWGKNIKKYFTVSFVYPALQQIRNAASDVHFVRLWLSQILGLIS